MKKFILAAVFTAAAAVSFAAGSDFLGGAFTDDGLSARPAGMGGAFTALADDGNASWWNPAGLAVMESKSKSMSLTYVPSVYKLTEGGISKFIASYGQGDNTGYGALGASISYMSADIAASYAGDRDYGWTEYHTLKSIRKGEKRSVEIIDVIDEKESKYPANHVIMRFLENHDEQRSFKIFGMEAIEAYATVLMTAPGLPLIYAGQEIGELEIFIAQPIPAEMSDQLAAGFIRHHTLVPLRAHETDVVQHVLQRLVALAQPAKRLV